MSGETIIWDSSDHYPICLSMGDHSSRKKWSPWLKKKIFRFEAKWAHVSNFDSPMKEIWNRAHNQGDGSWRSTVKRCGKLLLQWDEETFKRTQWRIAWLKKRAQCLKSLPQNRIVLEECREVEKDLRELRRDEETAAWQRCRQFILRDGDKNTLFFMLKLLVV